MPAARLVVVTALVLGGCSTTNPDVLEFLDRTESMLRWILPGIVLWVLAVVVYTRRRDAKRREQEVLPPPPPPPPVEGEQDISD